MLSSLATPVERDVYAGKLSRETGVARDTILAQVNAILAKKRRTKEKKEWQDIQSGRQYYADRVNPQKALNKREAIAEERIIAFLYKDNGFVIISWTKSAPMPLLPTLTDVCSV